MTTGTIISSYSNQNNYSSCEAPILAIHSNSDQILGSDPSYAEGGIESEVTSKAEAGPSKRPGSE